MVLQFIHMCPVSTQRWKWNRMMCGMGSIYAFFHQSLELTLSPKGSASSIYRKDKTRITFIAACNSSGTEKIPLMVVGKAARPRSFSSMSGAELGFVHLHYSKAWMTKGLFFPWMGRFDKYVGRMLKQNVSTLFGNCSAHGSKNYLPVLKNGKMEFGLQSWPKIKTAWGGNNRLYEEPIRPPFDILYPRKYWLQ